MKTREMITLPLFLLTLSGIVTIAQTRKGIDAPKPTKFEARFEAKIDKYINGYVRGGNFSGSILIAKGGQVLLSKGYGMASYENNIPDTAKTKFHIASFSKSFTAAAILLLDEQGRIGLNDTISKFIPDYPAGDKSRYIICLLIALGFQT